MGLVCSNYKNLCCEPNVAENDGIFPPNKLRLDDELGEIRHAIQTYFFRLMIHETQKRYLSKYHLRRRSSSESFFRRKSFVKALIDRSAIDFKALRL